MIANGKTLAAAILLALACGAMPSARADLVYTETFSATGTLGGVSFTDQVVTLTAYGDLSTYFSTPAIAFVDAPVATVAISGLGTAYFSDTLDVFVAYNPGFGGIFGISDFNSPNGGDILDVRNPAFLSYDLRTPLSPTVGDFADFMSLNNPSATSAGDLVFTSVGGQVLVQAAVPGPASLVMMGSGILAALGGLRGRRRR